jgi:hypothetical protein
MHTFRESLHVSCPKITGFRGGRIEICLADLFWTILKLIP